MYRRTYLRGLGAAGVASVAGCLASSPSSTPTGPAATVVLPEPDRRFESSDVPYPAWGQRIPDVTLPAPLDNRTVSLRSVDRPRLLTFFYSHCRTVCPVLLSTMRNVQSHALNNDYGDEVAFYPVTFDPERDDAARLRAYARERNIAADAGNWHFLRPESRARAERVVQRQFGVAFERTTPEGTDRYMFSHTPLILLVNGDDYVERAYRTKTPDAEQIIGDLRRVRQA